MLGGVSGAHIGLKTPEIAAALISAEFQTAIAIITHVLLAPQPEVRTRALAQQTTGCTRRHSVLLAGNLRLHPCR